MSFLVHAPIDHLQLIASVEAPARGGVASFLGLVRDHHEGREVIGLDYSAYEPMAEAVIGAVVTEAESRWPVAVAVRHRLGPLVIGEAAVAVVVGGGHRAEVFEACRYVIEEIKRRVPIWKRERYAGGAEAWVDPTAESRAR
jgi:molybdopterin synthase catalytic subunit